MGITGTLIVLLAAAAPPSVDVVTLQGRKESGELQKITAESVVVKTGDKQTEIPLSEMMHVAFPKTSPVEQSDGELELTLVDGTQLLCTEFTTEARTATVVTPAFGTLKLPTTAIHTMRFTKGSKRQQEAWAEYITRKDLKDIVIIVRPTGALDHLACIVDRVDEKKVKAAFGDLNPEFDRVTKCYGVVYSRRNAATAKPTAALQMAGGDVLNAAGVTWDGEKLQAKLLSGTTVDVEIGRVAKLDFSLGKIKHLSDMEPREADFTPFIPDPLVADLFQYRKDQTDEGKPLQLGSVKYERGLWIHSRTELKYRINGEYRRFRAVMGIDYSVAQNGRGHVYVKISGDGKTLFEGPVAATDASRPLDLDVGNVRDLEILVDYGKDNDTSDHLVLGDARLVK